MKIDEDKSILQSSMGSLLSFVMFLMMFVFAYLKVEMWITKKGVDIASATYDSYFDDE